MKTIQQVNPENMFCDRCKKLTQTEEAQETQKNIEIKYGGHICRVYQQRLRHGNHHPLIPRLLACLLDDAKDA